MSLPVLQDHCVGYVCGLWASMEYQNTGVVGDPCAGARTVMTPAAKVVAAVHTLPTPALYPVNVQISTLVVRYRSSQKILISVMASNHVVQILRTETVPDILIVFGIPPHDTGIYAHMIGTPQILEISHGPEICG